MSRESILIMHILLVPNEARTPQNGHRPPERPTQNQNTYPKYPQQSLLKFRLKCAQIFKIYNMLLGTFVLTTTLALK